MKACQDAQAEAAENSSSKNSASESKEEDKSDYQEEDGGSEEGGESGAKVRRLQINEWSRNPNLKLSLADRIRLELDIDEDYIDEDIAE